MSLRKRATSKATETAKATEKIGFCGKISVVDGVVARFAKAAEKEKCFVPYADNVPESETRSKATVLANKVTGRPQSDFMACLRIKVERDTSLTPMSRFNCTYVEMGGRKQYGNFIFDHMSSEIDELETGKSFWAHIAWVRLTPEYGGDLTLVGDDANDELAMIITYLPTKKDAQALVNSLQERLTSTDDLCRARGYDIDGIRETIKSNAKDAKDSAVKTVSAASVNLTAITEETAKFHVSLEDFLSPSTVQFLQDTHEQNGGNVDDVAAKCGCTPGEAAILLGKRDYFTELISKTGKGEQESIAIVANDTGVSNPADLAKFLGIQEAAF